MTIKFLCPNGHQLNCSDDRAGKPGKCPKCGTKFMVPDAEEIAAAASGVSRQQPAEPAAVPAGAAPGGSGVGRSVAGSGKSTAVKPDSPSGVGKTAALPADYIVFLCPNGHRLNGPKSLQGKPGQCPHCGEKFRIPVYDEEPEEQLTEQPAAPTVEEEPLMEFPTEEAPAFIPDEEIPVGTAVENDASIESEAVETFPEEVEIVEEFVETGPALPAAPAIPPLPPGPSNQLFDVFSRLWSLKPEGATVELLLESGKTLTPIKYSPALSRQSFGVFAVQEADGSYRIITLRWETVTRIDFQKVTELPAGVFG